VSELIEILESYSPAYRKRVRALSLQRFEAIKKMGCKCQKCGFEPKKPIDFAKFEFHHVKGNILMEDNRKVIRKILKGETEEYELLCLMCHIEENHFNKTKHYFTEIIEKDLEQWIEIKKYNELMDKICIFLVNHPESYEKYFLCKVLSHNFKISKDKVLKLLKSLEEFGMIQSSIIDNRKYYYLDKNYRKYFIKIYKKELSK